MGSDPDRWHRGIEPAQLDVSTRRLEDDLERTVHTPRHGGVCAPRCRGCTLADVASPKSDMIGEVWPRHQQCHQTEVLLGKKLGGVPMVPMVPALRTVPSGECSRCPPPVSCPGHDGTGHALGPCPLIGRTCRPAGRTGVTGMNRLGAWGESCMAHVGRNGCCRSRQHFGKDDFRPSQGPYDHRWPRRSPGGGDGPHRPAAGPRAVVGTSPRATRCVAEPNPRVYAQVRPPFLFVKAPLPDGAVNAASATTPRSTALRPPRT